MKRKQIPAKVRRRVYKKYGGRCAYCGRPIAYKEMQVEHFVPLAKGGADSEENYMPSCRTCNHYKHTLTIEQFREEIGQLTNRLRERSYIYKLALRHGQITESTKPVRFYFEQGKEAAESTKSHSEKEIVKQCISLIQELTGRFEDYLDFMNIVPENDEERFSTEFTYFKIVQRLLLWTTSHSGGTSTIMKCQELGFDSGDTVCFEDERHKEGAADD